ncbi:glycosyltransferase family 2 protein [Agromyces larvae]|uniref:Glycosyltransferase family 2 protein n=1 Tax=Agromyces larvae TaxID=2929802 RepID=A0ABY4BYS5_9MICO|nr:glycosyltransferase family 2 protein [Agromyces larvae]UOE44313.1 glycosyltransferase family 2 protein [Agromyces larvae]
MAIDCGLDVVIVTYASEAHIRQCLDSLFRHRPSCEMRVLLVDNDSPDSTLDVVRGDYSEVLVIAREHNDGFAVANNAALRATTAPFVLVLNPDTEIEAGTLDHLMSVMANEQSIGVLGCRLLTADGTLDHASKRSFPSPMTAAKYFLLKAIGRSGSAYVRPDVDENSIADVDAINGAFMLVRARAMDEVGLFDEKYWMYGEDLDWCARFHSAGWRVVYDGTVVAHHLKGGSTGGRRPMRLNYHFHRSMEIFYLDHVSSGHRLADAIVSMGIWLRFALTSVSHSVANATRNRPMAKKPAVDGAVD